MMAGPEPDMRAEKAYLTLLSQARSYKLDGGGLTLSDQNGNESLLFTAASAPASAQP
jgi:heat shock protein HslJ